MASKMSCEIRDWSLHERKTFQKRVKVLRVQCSIGFYRVVHEYRLYNRIANIVHN